MEASPTVFLLTSPQSLRRPSSQTYISSYLPPLPPSPPRTMWFPLVSHIFPLNYWTVSCLCLPTHFCRNSICLQRPESRCLFFFQAQIVCSNSGDQHMTQCFPVTRILVTFDVQQQLEASGVQLVTRHDVTGRRKSMGRGSAGTVCHASHQSLQLSSEKQCNPLQVKDDMVPHLIWPILIGCNG